jgi:hypothetical protein
VRAHTCGATCVRISRGDSSRVYFSVTDLHTTLVISSRGMGGRKSSKRGGEAARGGEVEADGDEEGEEVAASEEWESEEEESDDEDFGGKRKRTRGG